MGKMVVGGTSYMINGGGGGATFVVDTAVLACSKGSSCSELVITRGDKISLCGKKQANIADFVSGENIFSFGSCQISPDFVVPCTYPTCQKWSGGKANYTIAGELALLSTSVNICPNGGVISIVDNGQSASGGGVVTF